MVDMCSCRHAASLEIIKEVDNLKIEFGEETRDIPMTLKEHAEASPALAKAFDDWTTPAEKVKQPTPIAATPQSESLEVPGCAVRYESEGKFNLLQPGELVVTTLVNFNRPWLGEKRKHTSQGNRTRIVSGSGLSVSVEFAKPGFLPGGQTAYLTEVYEQNDPVFLQDYGETAKRRTLPFRARWYFIPSVRSLKILTELREKLTIFTKVGKGPSAGRVYALMLSQDAWTPDQEAALYAKLKRHHLCGWLGLGLPPVMRRPV